MSPDAQHADLSCISCRRLKRKCTKDLPRCALCQRVGRSCEYLTPPSTPGRSHASSDVSFGRPLGDRPFPSIAALTRGSTGLDAPKQQLPTRSRSNLAACFLDSVQSRGAVVDIPDDLLWKDVSSDVEPMSVDDAWTTAERYFATTHEWLPIGLLVQIPFIHVARRLTMGQYRR